jgi:hypothetical protein
MEAHCPPRDLPLHLTSTQDLLERVESLLARIFIDYSSDIVYIEEANPFLSHHPSKFLIIGLQRHFSM